MTASVWDELAIPPTDDPGAIRRAYAMRLKRCRPDDDPAAFVQLRAAYEQALLGTARPAAVSVPRETLPLPEKQVAVAIARGDVEQAASLLLAARGDSTVPLGRWMWLTEHLAWRLAQDRQIGEDAVEAIARQFGWFGGSGADTTAAAKALRGRIEAARWLAAVHADAAKYTRYLGNEHAEACALMVGQGRMNASWLLPPYAQLHRVLSDLRAHGPWVERTLHAERISRLRALVGDSRGQQVRRYGAALAAGGAFAAAGQMFLAVFVPLLMLPMPPSWLRRFLAMALLWATAAELAGDTGVRYGLPFAIAGFVGLFGIAAVVRLAPLLRRDPIEAVRLAGWLTVRLLTAGTACVAAVYFVGPHGLGGTAGAASGLVVWEALLRFPLACRWIARWWARQAPSLPD